MKTVFSFPAILRGFLHGKGGGVTIMLGLILPIIGGTALFSMDHMRATQQLAAMQKAADAAALASVRQLPFIDRRAGNDDDPGAYDEALTVVAAGLVRGTLKDSLPDTHTVAELLDDGLVRVSLSARYGSLFGEMGAFGENPFTVTASAQTFGGQNVCMIALGSDKDEPAIRMNNSAEFDAQTCEIYSSSTRKDSVSVKDSARLNAQFICSAGGYDGSKGHYSTLPATDCTQIDDPLAGRPPPPGADAPCDYKDMTYDGDDGAPIAVMLPGVYCGKTDLKDGTKVTMAPGIFIFRDGELHVHKDSSLSGEGVGLYFDDRKAFFKFMDNGVVKLSAPTTGPMAGMLIAARPLCKDGGALVSVTIGSGDKSCESGRKFSISSSEVEALLGTIHLPTDKLTVDTTMPVSKEAAFTILVVGQLELKQAPSLVLNTDYESTNVPVPSGFREGGSTAPRLID